MNRRGFYKLFIAGILLQLGSSFVRAADYNAPALNQRMMILVIQIGVMLIFSKIFYLAVKKIKLPGFLGEILSGIIIGPFLLGGLSFYGFDRGLFPGTEGFIMSPELYGFCSIAVILFLFMAGLDTGKRIFKKNFLTYSFISIAGLIFSFAAGVFFIVFISKMLFNDTLHYFSPVTLLFGVLTSVSSVKISSRLLSRIRKIDSPEGITIQSGNTINTVLGMILLSAVFVIMHAVKNKDAVNWMHFIIVSVRTALIWAVSVGIAVFLSKKSMRLFKSIANQSNASIFALGLALILSGLFEDAGLMMIIGAYVTGFSLSKTDIAQTIKEKINPVYRFTVPIFFCSIGMMIDVNKLFDIRLLLIGIVFGFIAVFVKMAGTVLPSAATKFNFTGALRIGAGMMPRGEFTVIVAGIGLMSGLIFQELLIIVFIMVLFSNIITPPVLMMLFNGRALINKKGVKKDTIISERISFTIEFPSSDITRLLFNKLIDMFESENFYINIIDRTEDIYQIRKDEISVSIYTMDNGIIFNCDKEQESFVYTSIYMVMVDLEQTIKTLKGPLDKTEILKKIQPEDFKKRTVFDLSKYLTPELILPALKGKNKAEIIDELLDLLYRKDMINDKLSAKNAIWERENIMSTGMQHGIAIPHGKADGVTQLVCAIGIKKDGIDFDSIDGEPSRIFIITLSPKSFPAPHVQFMSTVARTLSEENCRLILSSASNMEIYNIFTGRYKNKKVRNEDGYSRLTVNLEKILDPELFILDMKAESKEEAINELLSVIVKKHSLSNIDMIKDEIIKREKLISTGLSDGIAIPHARIDSSDKLICAVGLSKKGIPFDSLDNKPGNIIILTLSPKNNAIPHIQLMSMIIKTFIESDRSKLLSFTDKTEFYEYLTKNYKVTF